MRETLEKYRDVEYLDTLGRRQKVSYGIYYWGRKTYDSFKTNLQEIIEYMSNHGGSISALYAGTRMSTANINAINTSLVIPHRAQCTAIKNRLISEFRRLLPPGSYTDAEIIETISSAVDTVERFQGQQKDIIIAGYVLGNEDAIGNEEAFIYDPCRLNVVISRARYKAVILASKELMDNISNDLEILELQKSFQKLKDYCCDISHITEPGWNNGVLYLREI